MPAASCCRSLTHDDFPEDAPTYKVRMRALGPDGEAFDDVCIHLVDRRMMCIG